MMNRLSSVERLDKRGRQANDERDVAIDLKPDIRSVNGCWLWGVCILVDVLSGKGESGQVIKRVAVVTTWLDETLMDTIE